MVIVAALAVWGIFAMMQNSTPQVSVVQPTQNTGSQTAPEGSNTNDTPDTNMEVDVEVSIPASHTVTYTNAGYAPAELKIKTGDTVVFKNQSSNQVWTGSAMHPSHMVYGGTSLQQHCPDTDNNDFDQCKAEGAGTQWSFTFTKKGTWGYHNHMNSSHFGKIIVE